MPEHKAPLGWHARFNHMHSSVVLANPPPGNEPRKPAAVLRLRLRCESSWTGPRARAIRARDDVRRPADGVHVVLLPRLRQPRLRGGVLGRQRWRRRQRAGPTAAALHRRREGGGRQEPPIGEARAVHVLRPGHGGGGAQQLPGRVHPLPQGALRRHLHVQGGHAVLQRRLQEGADRDGPHKAPEEEAAGPHSAAAAAAAGSGGGGGGDGAEGPAYPAAASATALDGARGCFFTYTGSGLVPTYPRMANEFLHVPSTRQGFSSIVRTK